MKSTTKSLYIFSNDLRLDDNPSLSRAAENTDELLCVYIVEPRLFKSNRYFSKSLGTHRWRFLQESLNDIEHNLKTRSQRLLVIYEPFQQALAKIISIYNPHGIYHSFNIGFYEQAQWRELQKRYPYIDHFETSSHQLFAKNQLPFAIEDLPDSFSKFRRKIEPVKGFTLTPTLQTLPKKPGHLLIDQLKNLLHTQLPVIPKKDKDYAGGGAKSASRHVQAYFSSAAPSCYKETRNALDDWDSSTKMSPWLANGCLSVRQLVNRVLHYEEQVTANESTYWIIFELLWREYFHWYAERHQARLFALFGAKKNKVLTSFYGERFQRWCQGNTPYPVVNACMKQLNATGYMSNRGRQLVASCFVNELGLDWRYGAAYFEQQLLDYDVASNWGNWQYLAGVGADPRGKRHFNLQKQTELYDPRGEFIAKWQGDNFDGPIDSTDAADWPIGN
ncbi:MAG: deoxyribodipyrimidine photo-lyase [Cellvibrionaceae bacterium]|jgi:deoxyribodipyrimidine photo-lyase